MAGALAKRVVSFYFFSSLSTLPFHPVPVPLGRRIPDLPHAVSVSLPTISDIVAFKKKEPAMMEKVRSGYPRFVKHPYIVEFTEAYHSCKGLDATEMPLFFASKMACEDALQLHPQFFQVTTDVFQGVSAVVVKVGSEEELAFSKYLQHTGTGLSSREAEDLMSILETGRQVVKEDTAEGGHDVLESLLQRWFSPSVPSVILPCKSGMNAFYSVFRGINRLQSSRNRRNWISIGWLYLDTMQILDRYLEPGGRSVWFSDPLDTQRIIDYIETQGSSVAGLILEAPTNPLVHTPDIRRISEACRKAGIITVMDPSLVSPRNVDLSPWCDVVCCSLTKFAAYEGNILIGAVAVNTETGFGRELVDILPSILTPPYHRDSVRLAASLRNADQVLDRINVNTMALADFFEGHAGVEKAYWAYAKEYQDRYRAIHRAEACPGSIITLKLKRPLPEFYDPLPLPKGPSFGAEFTLVCAYMYVAHYDILGTAEGQRLMKEADIDPGLVRLSIGVEPVDDLIRIFDEALR